jgi:crooked neck
MLLQLREFDNVRQLYQKYLEYDPSNSAAWIKYAELETQLEDFTCAHAIFELGVSQQPLSMPELLWKAYVEFETEEDGSAIGAEFEYEGIGVQRGSMGLGHGCWSRGAAVGS